MTSLERAFEIAKSGTADTVTEIRLRLHKEGLDPQQLEGRQLQEQIKRLIKAARGL